MFTSPKFMYIDGLGTRNPVTDCEQIIWFWEQKFKGKKKAVITAHYLKMRQYVPQLRRINADILADFIERQTTEQQAQKSAEGKALRQAKGILELDAFLADYRQGEHMKRVAASALHSIRYN